MSTEAAVSTSCGSGALMQLPPGVGLAGCEHTADAGGHVPREVPVFFAPLVPALAVVVVGYLVGYGLTVLVSRGLDAAFDAPLGPGVPEVVGWLLGLALLIGLVRWLLRRRRRRAGRQK